MTGAMYVQNPLHLTYEPDTTLIVMETRSCEGEDESIKIPDELKGEFCVKKQNE